MFVLLQHAKTQAPQNHPHAVVFREHRVYPRRETPRGGLPGDAARGYNIRPDAFDPKRPMGPNALQTAKERHGDGSAIPGDTYRHL